MSAGLIKILDKIARDPSNFILIDRYLILVEEIKENVGKIEHLLNLANILVEPDPRYAIQIGALILKYDNNHVPTLKMIENSLRNLGRLAKAEIIHNEIIKIINLQAAENSPNLKVEKTNQLSKSSIDNIITPEFKPPIPIAKKKVPVDPFVDISKPIKKDVFSKETNDTVKLDSSPSFSLLKNNEPLEPKKPKEPTEQKLPVNSEEEKKISPKLVSISKAIQKREKEKTPLPKKKESFSPPLTSSSKPLKGSSDIWIDHLNELINTGKARKALYEILNKLTPKSPLSLAEKIWPVLPAIWKCLEVNGFNWTPKDGVQKLYDNLNKQPEIKISKIAVFSTPDNNDDKS